LTTFSGSRNGADVVEEEGYSPFLLVQSDGTDLNVLGDELKLFVKNLLNLEGEGIVGQHSKFACQFKEPPIDLSNAVAFNPVYRGLHQDNDRYVLGKKASMRPKFERPTPTPDTNMDPVDNDIFMDPVDDDINIDPVG
jgi:hypothetical protein